MSETRLEPKGQNVLLEIVTESDTLAQNVKASSGLLIPEVTQGEPKRGVVYSVSEAIESPEYGIGDTVVFRTEDLFEGFKWDDKKLVSVKSDEILAVISEGVS